MASYFTVSVFCSQGTPDRVHVPRNYKGALEIPGRFAACREEMRPRAPRDTSPPYEGRTQGARTMARTIPRPAYATVCVPGSAGHILRYDRDVVAPFGGGAVGVPVPCCAVHAW